MINNFFFSFIMQPNQMDIIVKVVKYFPWKQQEHLDLHLQYMI